MAHWKAFVKVIVYKHIKIATFKSFSASSPETLQNSLYMMTSTSIGKGPEVAYTDEPYLRTSTSSDLPNAIGANPWWKFGGHDRSFVTSRLGKSDSSLSSQGYTPDNNNDGSVFSDSRAAEFYEPIEKYEGRHRFDPRATWSDEEERKLIRKVTKLYTDRSIPNCKG